MFVHAHDCSDMAAKLGVCVVLKVFHLTLHTGVLIPGSRVLLQQVLRPMLKGDGVCVF